MSLTITPTVGRKVWFYRDDKQVEPFDATVIKVHADEGAADPNVPCTLYVIDDGGSVEVHKGVEASEVPIAEPHFRWMPYQQKQAEKEGSVSSTAKPI